MPAAPFFEATELRGFRPRLTAAPSPCVRCDEPELTPDRIAGLCAGGQGQAVGPLLAKLFYDQT